MCVCVCVGGQWAGPPEDCGRPQAFLDRRASAPWRVRELLDDLLEGVKARDTEALDYCLEELRPWQEWLMLHRFDRRRSQSSASAICARHAEVNELKERMTVTKLRLQLIIESDSGETEVVQEVVKLERHSLSISLLNSSPRVPKPSGGAEGMCKTPGKHYASRVNHQLLVVLSLLGVCVALFIANRPRMDVVALMALVVPTGACSAWPSLKIVIKPTPQRPHHILSWRGMNRRNI